MEQVQAAVPPQRDPRVGDVQSRHGAGGRNDVAILDAVLDRGDAILRDVLARLRAEADLDLPQLREERRVFAQLAVGIRMGRHEVDRLRGGDAPQLRETSRTRPVA